MYSLVIADDEEKIREGVRTLFPWERMGFSVSAVCSDGREVLDFVRTHAVDVVMTDVEMPHLDGIALIEALQEQPGLRSVLFSSHQQYEYLRSAIRLQAADYLLKPLNAAEVLACFERIREELDGERVEQPASFYGQILDIVNRYMEAHYRNASLEEAAQLASLSPSYLSRLYKEKAGICYSDRLFEIRMRHACTFLDDVRYKSYEIADLVGYDNPTNFTRAFKNRFGMTPKEYRTRQKERSHG